MRIALVCLLAAAVGLSSGCSSVSCKSACKKLAKCYGIVLPDSGGGEAGVAEGTGGGDNSPGSDSTKSDDNGGAFTGGENWTCPLSQACDPLEKCKAKCISKASCEAITGDDTAGAAELATCYAQCETSAVDGGNPDGTPGDQGPVDGPMVSEGPLPDQYIVPDQYIMPDTVTAPDLMVSSFSATVSGTSVTYSAKVCNYGGSTSSTLKVGLFYHSTATPMCGSGYSTSKTLYGLGSGSCETVSFSRSGVPAGSYKAWIFVDAYCAISELSESNNVKSYNYTVAAPQPDLAISSFSAVASGSTVTYEVAYCNNGGAFSSTVKLALYYDPTSTPGCSTPYDDYKNISGMTAGQCSVAYLTRSGTPAGSYTSWVRLDGTCALTETSESNNSASKNVTVGGSTTCSSTQTYDFEAGSMQGVTQSSSDSSYGVQWQPSSARYHGGSYALYYGSLTAKNFDSGSSNYGTATLPTVSIPSSGSSTLTFWLWMSTESSTSYDKLSVTTGGSSGTSLWAKSSSTLQSSWQQITVDLSGYAGSSLSPTFYFNTVDGSGNTGEGVYIDDIELKLGCP